MARGFESKDVEFQQAEAQRDKAPARTAQERESQSRRRSVELSLARVRADLERATSPAHRTMLEGAIAALEQQLEH